MPAEPPEIEALEQTAAWRLRQLDADPADTASADAASRLGHLAADLRRTPYPEQWSELTALLNWLGESDLISDYADLAAGYRVKIGISEHPANGGAYLAALLAIARDLL